MPAVVLKAKFGEELKRGKARLHRLGYPLLDFDPSRAVTEYCGTTDPVFAMGELVMTPAMVAGKDVCC